MSAEDFHRDVKIKVLTICA